MLLSMRRGAEIRLEPIGLKLVYRLKDALQGKSNPKPKESPATDALKVQAIRSKGQPPRLYVYFPLPLAAAIGLGAGEEVQWELPDRGELHLARIAAPPPLAKRRAKPR